MNTKKVIELKERIDKAYSLLCALALDTNATLLSQIVSRDARNHVSIVKMDLDRMLERRK
jgi:hypothetical protein